MRITEIGVEEGATVIDVYERVARDVPLCCRVDEDDFVEGLLWSADDHSLHSHLRDQRLLVCWSDGRPEGFAHIAIEDRHGERNGVIRFLAFPAGQRRTGQALLKAAEEALRAEQVMYTKAFPMDYGYPFHLNATGLLSGRLAHVLGLLGASGYEVAPQYGYRRCQEILFDRPNLCVACPDSPDDGLQVHTELDESVPGIPKATFRLTFGGREVGESETWPSGRWTRSEDAVGVFSISVDINEAWQGRGWGRHLLLSGLWQMQELGYRGAVLGTNVENYRAISMYSNLGFVPRDVGTSMVRRPTNAMNSNS